jgi:hypothetical protein
MSAIVFLLPIQTRPFASHACRHAFRRTQARLRPKCTVEFLNSCTCSEFASTPGVLDVMGLTFAADRGNVMAFRWHSRPGKRKLW